MYKLYNKKRAKLIWLFLYLFNSAYATLNCSMLRIINLTPLRYA